MPSTTEPTVFHSTVVPSVSLSEYGALLIARLPHCPAELLLASIVLVRRYCSSSKTAPSMETMHRMYAAAMYIAMCAHCDYVVKPSDFANVAGLHAAEMPRLTGELLHGLEWRTHVTRTQIETLLVAACDPLL